jgi:hypothetical protein
VNAAKLSTINTDFEANSRCAALYAVVTRPEGTQGLGCALHATGDRGDAWHGTHMRGYDMLSCGAVRPFQYL